MDERATQVFAARDGTDVYLEKSMRVLPPRWGPQGTLPPAIYVAHVIPPHGEVESKAEGEVLKGGTAEP